MKTITWFYLILSFVLPAILQAQPVVNIGSNATICGDSLVLDAANVGATYLWNTGATTQTLTVYTSGTYWVDVTNGATTRDSIVLVIQPRPVITYHPSDTGVCIGMQNVTAVANSGIIRWFDYLGNVLGYGNSLSYNVQDTVTLLYESSNFSLNSTIVARTITGPGSGSGFANVNCGMRFNATQPIIINSVRIRLDAGPFTALIQLENSANQIIASQPISYNAAGYYDVPLNFNVPIGTNYTLYMRNMAGGQAYALYPFNSWALYTYPFMVFTGTTFTDLYGYFYEWRVSTLGSTCSSPRDSVTLDALTTPIVNLHADTTLCGGSLVLDATNPGLGFNYLWNTGATTSSIVPSATGTYKVTASVGGNCAVVDSMNLTVNIRPAITQHPPDTGVCIGLYQLNALASAGTIRWLDDTLGNIIGYGNTLSYNVQDTVTIWYEANQYEINPTVVGRIITGAGAGSGYANVNCGMRFNAIQPIIINTVRINIDAGPFTALVQLENSLGQIIGSQSISYPTAGYYDVPLNFSVPIGTNYTLYMRNMTGGQAFALFPFNSWALYTYPFIALTGTTFTDLYGYFYEWNLSTLGNLCSSGTNSVTLDALTTPIVNLHADTTLCGGNLVLNATNPGPGFNYLWSTGETTSTIMADTTGTYKVTASVGGNCAIVDSMNLTVNIRPAITQHPPDTSICIGLYQLNALASAGTIRWLDTSGTILGYGNTLSYNVQDTVTIRYEANQYEINPTVVGRIITGAGAGSGYANVNCGMRFNAIQPIIINTVRIRIDAGPFTALVQLENSLGQVIGSQTISYPAAGYYDVPLNFSVPIGTDYTLYMRNITGGQVFAFFPYTNWAAYTYPFIALTGTTATNLYGYFYEWNLSTLGNVCSSQMDFVVLNALETPVVDLRTDTVLCGSSLVLDATNSGIGFNYLWSTGETTATIVADTTAAYGVTVSVGGNCSVQDSMNLVVNTKPIITQHPSDTALCKGLHTITAIGNAGVIQWLDSLNNVLGYGNTLNYNVQDTLTIQYRASQFEENPTVVGRLITGPGAGSGFANVNCGMRFNAIQPIILNTVKIRTDGAFTALVQLENSVGQIIDSVTIYYAAAGTYDVPLGFNIPIGMNYTLYMRNITLGQVYAFFPFTNWVAYTYPFIALTGTTSTNLYGYFYEWNLSTLGNLCSSDSASVVLSALETPVVNLRTDTVLCGSSLVLDATNSGIGFNYLWNTGETTATITADTTATYEVTVSIGGSCPIVDSMNLVVNLKPSITQHPADMNACKGLQNITALADAGTIRWLDTMSNVLGYGNSFNYNVQDTVTIWYESSQFEINPTVIGRSLTGPGSTSGTADVNCGMRFNAIQPIIINTVKIRIDNGPFTALVQLENAAGQIINSQSISYATAGYYDVPLGFNVPIGTNYTLYLRNITGGDVYAFYPITNWAIYTYPFIALTGTTSTNLYGYFYEWNLSTLGNLCSSGRDSVTINALETPTINLEADSVYCQDSIVLDIFYPNATYYWANNTTNSTLLVTQEGNYSVTSTIGSCAITDSIYVYLNPIPTISVLSPDTTTCAGLIPRVSTGADVMSWYSEQTNGTYLGQGNYFMYNAQNTDTIWAEGQNFSNKLYLQGLTDTFVAALSDYYFLDNLIKGLSFNAHENIKIKNVSMFIVNAPFIGTIQLWDANDNVVNSINVALMNEGENLVPLNFIVPAGQQYKLLLTSYSTNTVAILLESPFAGFPIVGDYLTILQGIPYPQVYHFFHKWNIQRLSCPSDRIPSNITVLPTPNVDFPTDTIICGDTLVLDVSASGAQNYLWSTGATTSSIIIDSSTTVSLVETIGICSDEDSINVFVVEPPDLIIPPTDTIVCAGNLTLYASGNAPYYAWYNSQTGNTPFAFGDSILFHVDTTTTIWVEGIGFIPKSNMYGAIYNPNNGSNSWVTPQYSFYPTRGMSFTVNSPFILNRLSVYTDSVTTVTLALYKSGFPYYVRNLALNNMGENVIQIDTILEPGNYFIELSNNSKGSLLIQNPYTNLNQLNRPEITFTGSSPITGQYNYFFNWKVSTPSCATDRLPVKIDVPPSPPITMAADTATCVLSNIVLDPIAINSPLYTYFWSNGSTADTLVTSSQGYYAVTVTNDGKCSSAQDIYVQFLSTPNTPSTNDASICAPGYTNLGTNPNDGIVVWYDTAGQATYLTAPYPVYIQDTTNFYLDIAPRAVTRIGKQSHPFPNDASGYLGFIIANTFDVHEYAVLDSVAIYVQNAPATVSIELMDSTGQVLDIATYTVQQARTKTFIPLDFVIPPSQKYQLTFASIGTPFLVDEDSTATPSSSSAGIATLTGTTLPGVDYASFFDWHFSYAYPTCRSGADTFTVTVNMPVSLLDSMRVCDTAFINIQHPNVASYIWSNGLTTGIVALSNTGNYTVTISDGAACTVIDTVHIQLPRPIGFAGNASCNILSAGGYTDAEASFLWSTGDTTATITLLTTGIYRVTVTTNEGCVLIDTAYISQIIPPSTYTPVLSTYTPFCISGVLDAGFGGQGMSYLWNTGAITQQITVDSAGFYSVTVTHPYGCSGSDYTYVTINYPPQALFTWYETGLTVLVDNNSIGLNTAQNSLWNMGDGTTYPVTNPPAHTYDTAGCYRITLIATNTCGSDTASVVIGVGPGVSDSCTIGIHQIQSVATNFDFQIAPNPNNGQFRLNLTKALDEDSQLMILDVNGRIVHQEELRISTQTQWEIQTEDLPAGVYFARLVNSQQSRAQRFVVLRE